MKKTITSSCGYYQAIIEITLNFSSKVLDIMEDGKLQTVLRSTDKIEVYINSILFGQVFDIINAEELKIAIEEIEEKVDIQLKLLSDGLHPKSEANNRCKFLLKKGYSY